MVRSLGVKIGGATVPAQPMEMLQTHLANPSESATDTLRTQGASCPFSAMVQDTFNTTQGDLHWAVEAEQRLERAPSFVRAMVRRGIEEFAREQGYAEITPQVMDEARARTMAKRSGRTVLRISAATSSLLNARYLSMAPSRSSSFVP
jgi:hypothetical protein